jgi:hypothetical protein
MVAQSVREWTRLQLTEFLLDNFGTFHGDEVLVPLIVMASTIGARAQTEARGGALTTRRRAGARRRAHGS